jgi:hypothetical protein
VSVHPRDHVLGLAAQLRSDMTVLANVSCKVRVNGGAATIYTSATNPAIAQNADCAFGYELKLAANTFADGDIVERAWLYSGTAYAYGIEVIGPALVDGAHFTNARGDKLDELDSVLADVLTLLTRVPSDVWDELLANHTTASTFGHAAGSGGSDPWTTALPGGYTAGEAGAILAGLAAAIAQFATSPVTLISPTAVSGKLQLVGGDDYKAVDGRAIVRPYSGPALASVLLKIGDSFAVAGTIGSGSVSFELTHAQTLALPDTSDYEVVGDTAGGSEITIERGQCTVR